MRGDAGPSGDSSSRSRLLVGLAAFASLLLVGGYLAAGGSTYETVATADPCEPREWRDPEGIEGAAEQFSLSALDGAACELQVSREELAQALTTEASRQEFAERNGIEDAELEEAVRAGLVRGIDDAVQAGALSPLIAGPLRVIAERVPVDEGIALIEDSGQLFGDTQGFLESLPSLLDQASGLIPDEVEGLLP